MLAIYRPYITESPVSFEETVPSIEEFQGRITDYTKSFPWLVYEIGGQVVGYAYASAFKTRAAYRWSVESTVYLHESVHGKGIGKKLYLNLFQELKDQGVANVLAGITLPNQASIGLHENLGFVPVAHFKNVGFKFGKWWDVGYWQLQLNLPVIPSELLKPILHNP